MGHFIAMYTDLVINNCQLTDQYSMGEDHSQNLHFLPALNTQRIGSVNVNIDV